MPVQTTLLKLTVNCALHADNFHATRTDSEGKVTKCPACEFMIHYNQQIRKIEAEVASLNNALEGFMRTQSVVAASLGNKILTGVV